MPIVRIDYLKGKFSKFKTEVANEVHQALVDAFIPKSDKFHAHTEHDAIKRKT